MNTRTNSRTTRNGDKIELVLAGFLGFELRICTCSPVETLNPNSAFLNADAPRVERPCSLVIRGQRRRAHRQSCAVKFKSAERLGAHNLSKGFIYGRHLKSRPYTPKDLLGVCRLVHSTLVFIESGTFRLRPHIYERLAK
jgi:hypothetical protein